ncbi:MAG: LamG domain-containing protein [Anaerohalosphaera sp.]|nr:LamG domain-containing protein [Anaerohalosphaera sp.]
MDGNGSDALGNNDGIGLSVDDYTSLGSPDAVIGQAAEFSGSNKLTVNDNNDLDLDGGSTIQFWFKPNFDEPKNGTLINKPGAYRIDYEYHDLGIFGKVSRITADYDGVVVTSQDIPFDDKARMVSVVRRYDTLTIYIDGVSNAVTEQSGYFDATGSDLTIGDKFKGLMDEIAIYDTALAEYKIRAAYDKTKEGNNYCYLAGGSQTSGTQANFTIKGCMIPGFGGLSSDSCSRYGYYYCDASGIGYDTIEDAGGCTEAGNANWRLDPCCPDGYECNDDTVAGDYKCVQTTDNCADNDNKVDCEKERCIWITDPTKADFCTDSLSDYSCSFYTNTGNNINEAQENCKEDLYNLGKTGVGTEKCGTYVYDDALLVDYLIPMDSCKCAWNSDKCSLAIGGVPDVYGVNPENFTCFKSFTMGECTEAGTQDVEWDVEAVNSSAFSGLPQLEQDAALKATGCVEGSAERSCGDPIVKLPFFGFLEFAACCVIISMLYYFNIFKWEE